MKYSLITIISLLAFLSCSNDNEIPETDSPAETGENFSIVVGKTSFTATFHSTQAAKVFKSMLPLTIEMNDMNDNEKYYNLPKSLPNSPTRSSIINNGDLMLFGSNTLVIFYKTFSTTYSYTRIGKINNPAGLQTAMGSGNITIRILQ